jgi:hypothetical protein
MEIETMDNDITSFATKAFLREMRERIESAAGLLEAAGACSKVGRTAEAVALANKSDEHIHDAELLLGMTAWLARHGQGHDAEADNAGGNSRNDDITIDTAPGGATTSETVRVFLHVAHQRMERAVGVARGAEIRAATAGAAVGARMALAVEPLLYDAKTCANAASLLHRLASHGQERPPE